MHFITYACSYLIGTVLWCMGYSPSTWQFWAMLILYLLPNGFWFYKDYKYTKEDK